jgi:hypothetical protein
VEAQVASLKSQVAAAKSAASAAATDASTADTNANGALAAALAAQVTAACVKAQWNGTYASQWSDLGNYGGSTALVTVTLATYSKC